jgi:hypothetical protein
MSRPTGQLEIHLGAVVGFRERTVDDGGIR